MKKRLFLIPLLAVAAATPFAINAIVTNTQVSGEGDEILYSTDFEGLTINSGVDNSPDKQTGFIWCQDWEACKTVQHGGSTMLYAKAPTPDSLGWSAIGGFGTSSKGNLGKCVEGETYQVETYLEIHNIEYVEVEFKGGNKWGAARLFEDGTVLADATGGGDMVDVFYENNVLQFKFTYVYNVTENVNSYITFKAYNANDGYVYFDNCSIKHSKYVVNTTYDEYKVGEIDTVTPGKDKAYLYSQTSDMTSKTEIIDQGGDKKLKVSYHTNTANGQSVFFFNRMQWLNVNRDYEMSFDLKTTDINNLFLVYGGTWQTPVNEIKISMNSKDIAITSGDVFKDAKYQNDKLKIKFTVPDWESENDPYQILFIAEANANSDPTIIIDNIQATVAKILNGISIDTTNVKTAYNYGEEFSYDGLIAYAIYTDGSEETIDNEDLTFKGFSKTVVGKQTIIVSYEGFEAVYQITLKRIPSKLTLDTTNVKKTYGYGEEIDLTNLVVTLDYEDGGESKILQHDAYADGYSVFLGEFNSKINGTYTITIIYKDLTATFDVTVSFDVSYSFPGISY